jgi:ABC-type lipoprotein export system ATPase subunit
MLELAATHDEKLTEFMDKTYYLIDRGIVNGVDKGFNEAMT